MKIWGRNPGPDRKHESIVDQHRQSNPKLGCNACCNYSVVLPQYHTNRLYMPRNPLHIGPADFSVGQS